MPRTDPPLTDADATALEALYAAATPGPWCEVHAERASFIRKPSVRASDKYIIARFDRWLTEEYGPTPSTSKANADLIVSMHAALPRLLAERKRLREALVSIEEYWNDAPESAVDAAEEMRERARAALAPEGEG